VGGRGETGAALGGAGRHGAGGGAWACGTGRGGPCPRAAAGGRAGRAARRSRARAPAGRTVKVEDEDVADAGGRARAAPAPGLRARRGRRGACRRRPAAGLARAVRGRAHRARRSRLHVWRAPPRPGPPGDRRAPLPKARDLGVLCFLWGFLGVFAGANRGARQWPAPGCGTAAGGVAGPPRGAAPPAPTADRAGAAPKHPSRTVRRALRERPAACRARHAPGPRWPPREACPWSPVKRYVDFLQRTQTAGLQKARSLGEQNGAVHRHGRWDVRHFWGGVGDGASRDPLGHAAVAAWGARGEARTDL
jgi:hypothetical protein